MTRDRLQTLAESIVAQFDEDIKRERRQGVSFFRLLQRHQRSKGHMLNGGRIGDHWRGALDEIFSQFHYRCRTWEREQKAKRQKGTRA